MRRPLVSLRLSDTGGLARKDRITHRIDLAEIYRDTDNKARAREELQKVLSLPATDYNDRFYKERAAKDMNKGE